MLRKHTWKARRDAQTWRSRNKVTQAPFQIAPPYFLLSLLIDYIRDEYVHTSVYLVNPMSPLVNALTSFYPDINVRQRHDRLSSDLFDETKIWHIWGVLPELLRVWIFFQSSCDPNSNMCARSICTKFDPLFANMYQQMTSDIRICRVVVIRAARIVAALQPGC